MGIRIPDTMDLLALSGRKLVARIQAPAPCEQSLLPQNFVNAGYRAAILVLRIKDGCIHISDLLCRYQEVVGDGTGLGFDRIEQRDRRPGAHGPVSKQTADDPRAPAAEFESCQQVADDVVIVPGIEGDVVGASTVDHRAHYLLSLIAIEGRNFDGNNLVNFCEPTPKVITQDAAAHGRLQIKSDDGYHGRNRARVIEKN